MFPYHLIKLRGHALEGVDVGDWLPVGGEDGAEVGAAGRCPQIETVVVQLRDAVTETAPVPYAEGHLVAIDYLAGLVLFLIKGLKPCVAFGRREARCVFAIAAPLQLVFKSAKLFLGHVSFFFGIQRILPPSHNISALSASPSTHSSAALIP